MCAIVGGVLGQEIIKVKFLSDTEILVNVKHLLRILLHVHVVSITSASDQV